MIKRKRILQFPLAASKGGITQYVLNLWKNINKEIIQFDFVTFSKDLDFEYKLLEEGCRVYHLSCYPEEDEKQFVKEFNEILQNGYDVIELHTSYWKNTIMEVLAKKQGITHIIVHAHSTGIPANLTYEQEKFARERHYKIRCEITENLADRFLACSQEAAEWLYGPQISLKRIEIIKDTIETDKFKYDEKVRIRNRKKLGIENKYVIGHVGRLEKEKNHKYILKIFQKVHEILPHAMLLLVGDGSYKKIIKDQCKQMQLSKYVIFVGKTEAVSDYLQAMDIFLFPSLFEGFGISLLEAQCSGLPCIGSTNVPETVFATKYAKRISLEQPDDWVGTIIEIEKGYERKSQNIVLKENGYDTFTQIKLLEKMYTE